MSQKQTDSVSVIIPTNNRKKSLARTLNSIYKQSYPQEKLEVIIADNGSNDGTVKMIEDKYSQVKLIQLKRNIGVPAALNIALKKAKGKFIYQTNDDVVLDKNCLRQLMNLANTNQDIGVVGGKLYFLNEPNKPMLPSFQVVLWLGYHPKKTKQNKPSETDVTTGACMLIRKSMINLIGNFDEKFGPYGAEDYEFCYRARTAGFKVMHCPNAKVWVDDENINQKAVPERLYGHYRGKFRFMLLYASLWHNLIFFPIQLTAGPVYCYLQSGKKTTLPMIKALWWNIKNLKSTLKDRSGLATLKNLKIGNEQLS